MTYQIDLEVPRSHVLPLTEGTNWDLLGKSRRTAGVAVALQTHRRAAASEQAVHGSRTDVA